MMIHVIKGPAALSHELRGRVYWVGYASGHRACAKSRRDSNKAIEDAIKKENQ